MSGRVCVFARARIVMDEGPLLLLNPNFTAIKLILSFIAVKFKILEGGCVSRTSPPVVLIPLSKSWVRRSGIFF